jgi:hypothetical protein
MEQNTGLLEIHGELNGVRMAILELQEMIAIKTVAI